MKKNNLKKIKGIQKNLNKSISKYGINSEETRKLLEDGAQMGTEVPKERSAYWYLARSILLIALAIAVFWAVIYGLILYGQ